MSVQPDYGEKVTFIGTDETERQAIVLEPLPDSEYITVAVPDADPREDYIGTGWAVETSVYAHSDLGEEYTATTYAFRPGWE